MLPECTNFKFLLDVSEHWFVGGSYQGLWSLVRHSGNDSAVGMFWMIFSAVFQLRTLQVTGYFGLDSNSTSNSSLSPNHLFIGSILVYIMQLKRYNAHSILAQEVKYGILNSPIVSYHIMAPTCGLLAALILTKCKKFGSALF